MAATAHRVLVVILLVSCLYSTLCMGGGQKGKGTNSACEEEVPQCDILMFFWPVFTGRDTMPVRSPLLQMPLVMRLGSLAPHLFTTTPTESVLTFTSSTDPRALTDADVQLALGTNCMVADIQVRLGIEGALEIPKASCTGCANGHSTWPWAAETVGGVEATASPEAVFILRNKGEGEREGVCERSRRGREESPLKHQNRPDQKKHMGTHRLFGVHCGGPAPAACRQEEDMCSVRV
eukprot:3071392-Rhodomonas_salina.1